MPPRLRATLALAAALALAACSLDAPTSLYSDIAGTYLLQVASGATLTLRPDPRSSTTVTVTQGNLTLDPVWRFSVTYTLAPGSAASTVNAMGRYSVSGRAVPLMYDSGASQAATLDGGTLAVHADGGATLVFEKAQ